MIKLNKKEQDQIQNGLIKFQKVLQMAISRDLNESDTVAIITDMLADIWGYDKYIDITSEYAIRSTYCDLAIINNNKIEIIIECKAIGIALKEQHIKQAVDYGANQGCKWVVLTNGVVWRLYRIKFEQPISADLVFEFDVTSINNRSVDTKELLYLLHKNALTKGYKDQFYEKTLLINEYTIAQLLLSETVINAIKKESKKLSDDLKLQNDEILKLLKEKTIKRDLMESEESKAAQSLLKKANQKIERKLAKDKKTKKVKQEQMTEQASENAENE